MKQQFQWLMNLNQSFTRADPANDAPSSCILFETSDVFTKQKYGAVMNKIARLLETDANAEVPKGKGQLDLTAEKNQVHYFSMFGMYDLMLVCATAVDPSSVHAKARSFKEHFKVHLYATPKAGYEEFFKLIAGDYLYYDKGVLRRGSSWVHIARNLKPTISNEELRTGELVYQGYTLKDNEGTRAVSVTKNR